MHSILNAHLQLPLPPQLSGAGFADPGNSGRQSAGRQPHLESRARVTCIQQAWGTCTMVSVPDGAPRVGHHPLAETPKKQLTHPRGNLSATLPTHLIHSKLPLGLQGIYDRTVPTGKEHCCMRSSPYHLPPPRPLEPARHLQLYTGIHTQAQVQGCQPGWSCCFRLSTPQAMRHTLIHQQWASQGCECRGQAAERGQEGAGGADHKRESMFS